MEGNNKIFKKKGDRSSRIKNVLEGNYVEGSISNFRSETQDPANVLSFGGTLENSIDQDQIDQIKQFVRDTRKQSSPIETKNEILDLIDSNANAYSQFNTMTKIKYFYLKHEWTFIGIREITAITVIIISFLLYSSSLKVEKDYIDLATKSAAKINDLGKGNKFTLEFLKGSIEELLPVLDEDSMEELIKSIKIIR